MSLTMLKGLSAEGIPSGQTMAIQQRHHTPEKQHHRIKQNQNPISFGAQMKRCPFLNAVTQPATLLHPRTRARGTTRMAMVNPPTLEPPPKPFHSLMLWCGTFEVAPGCCRPATLGMIWRPVSGALAETSPGVECRRVCRTLQPTVEASWDGDCVGEFRGIARWRTRRDVGTGSRRRIGGAGRGGLVLVGGSAFLGGCRGGWWSVGMR